MHRDPRHDERGAAVVLTVKQCRLCKLDKALSDFRPQTRTCRACINAQCRTHYRHVRDERLAQIRLWQATHPEQRAAIDKAYKDRLSPEVQAERSRRYRLRYPDREEARRVRRHFGISLAEYREYLSRPCAICAQPSEHLDHCHATKRIRLALCAHCNKGLGLFKDRADLLTTAAAYLEAFNVVG